MVKQLILFVQFISIFFFQLFFTGDVTVTQKIPSSFIPDQAAIVEVIINKSDLLGFAKIQQDFPAGFSAEPIETKGATFSFKDDKLMLIWMNLPAEEQFTISYKLVANKSTLGKFTVGGNFSFVSENERKNIKIPSATFNVVKELALADVVEEEKELVASPVASAKTVAKVKAPEKVDVAEKVAVPTTELAAKAEVVEAPEKVTVMCKRTIEPVGIGMYKVTIGINKKGVEGFSKITETIPAGFIATEDNSNKGVFSFKNNTVKILWMGSPVEEDYTVSYTLKYLEGTKNGKYTIAGSYSYLENDAITKYVINATAFKLDVELVVVEETVIVTPPRKEKTIAPKKASGSIVAQVKKQKKQKKSTVNKKKVITPVVPIASKKKVTTIPKPEVNISYKVQVAAGHKKVALNYFVKVHKLQDKISTINHEGWIKYLVGSYGEYKAARDKRNVVRDNVKRAFVTAYNDGARITVQEALMISNQKWYN